MELSYALLAKSAEFDAEGSLTVMGGGITVLRADEFPFQPESLVLVAKMGFSPDECERDHQFIIDITDPNGTRINKEDAGIPVTMPKPELPNTKTHVGIVANFTGAFFPIPGDYTFRLSFDNVEIKKIVLHARLEPQATTAPAQPQHT